MQENKVIAFKRNLELHIKTDFNKETLDSICNVIKHINENNSITFEISDFQHLLTIENLKDSFKEQCFSNGYHIPFTSIGVNYEKHTDTKPYKMYLKICDSINIIKIYFTFYSDIYTLEYVDDFHIKVKEFKNKFELKKLELMRIYI